MRYFREPDVVFTNANGVSVTLKETRELEELETATEIEVHENDMLDEIATKRDVYGENAEALVYKLFDANAVEIIESGYNLGRVGKLKIPLV